MLCCSQYIIIEKYSNSIIVFTFIVFKIENWSELKWSADITSELLKFSIFAYPNEKIADKPFSII